MSAIFSGDAISCLEIFASSQSASFIHSFIHSLVCMHFGYGTNCMNCALDTQPYMQCLYTLPFGNIVDLRPNPVVATKSIHFPFTLRTHEQKHFSVSPMNVQTIFFFSFCLLCSMRKWRKISQKYKIQILIENENENKKKANSNFIRISYRRIQLQ